MLNHVQIPREEPRTNCSSCIRVMCKRNFHARLCQDWHHPSCLFYLIIWGSRRHTSSPGMMSSRRSGYSTDVIRWEYSSGPKPYWEYVGGTYLSIFRVEFNVQEALLTGLGIDGCILVMSWLSERLWPLISQRSKPLGYLWIFFFLFVCFLCVKNPPFLHYFEFLTCT